MSGLEIEKIPSGATGFGLVRFSTKRQADGDSYRRQTSSVEKFCAQEGLPLDDMLHKTKDIRDLGMSGFTGKHVIKGPLKKFFAGIDAKIVKPGDVLIVSEWSRLTRQVPIGKDEANPGALDLVIRLLRAGIGIKDLQDGAYYTLKSYNARIDQQVGLQMKISMAYSYSANLQHNVKAAWEGRRQKLAAGTAKATKQAPRRLTVTPEGGFLHVIRDHEGVPDQWVDPGDDAKKKQML
jgi:DNA invertase Pin-like site-specific DNA recombinase